MTYLAVTLKLERILMEHIDIKVSSYSKLQFGSICSIRILATNETSSKNRSSLVLTRLNLLFLINFYFYTIFVEEVTRGKNHVMQIHFRRPKIKISPPVTFLPLSLSSTFWTILQTENSLFGLLYLLLLCVIWRKSSYF